MLIGLIKDESAKYDGYNWHDRYAEFFLERKCEVAFLDFKKKNWQELVEIGNHDALMWRAWHRPADRDNAKNKIYYIDIILKKRIFPNWNMYWSYDNKIRQLMILKRLKIPHPKTFVSYDFKESLNFVKNCPLPIVSKCSEGACGDNVKLIKRRKALEKHIKKIFNDKGIKTFFPHIKQQGYVYLQEYFAVDKDLRIITIGNEIALAFWREGEDWKHNVSKGAKISPKNIPKEALDLSLKIVSKLDFPWCAFDMIFYKNKIYILEFSSIFGFSSPEQYTKHFGSPDGGILEKQVDQVIKILKLKK